MHPVLFYIGQIPIFAYGVLILLGMLVLFSTALSLGRRAGLPWDQLLPIALGVGVGGIVGARLSHLLVEPHRWTELLDFYSLFRPGTPGNIIGLMIGGYLGGTVVRFSLGLPPRGYLYAPALAAASVVWRTGCTMAGCCYGKETELPWAIFTENAYRHPTMIYEGIFNLIMVPVLWWAYPRFARGNALLFLYFACYAFFRFWLEFIRLYPPVALGLTGIQYLCLGILIGLGIWWWKQNRGIAPWNARSMEPIANAK